MSETSKTKLKSEWVVSPYQHSYYNYACKNCGCYEYQQIARNGKCRLMKYCPECGARMTNAK